MCLLRVAFVITFVVIIIIIIIIIFFFFFFFRRRSLLHLLLRSPALLEGGYRQQKGLGRGILHVFCSCSIVRLVPLEGLSGLAPYLVPGNPQDCHFRNTPRIMFRTPALRRSWKKQTDVFQIPPGFPVLGS